MRALLFVALAVTPVNTNVGEMARAYRDNEISADARFRGKALVVTGKVFAIGRDVNGHAHVALHDPLAPDWLVRCFPADETKLATLKTGQRATLTGTGAGLKRLSGFALLELSTCSIQ